MKKLLLMLAEWFKTIGCSECSGCNKKGVRFLYEDHFGTECDVYECKFCNKQYFK